MDALVGAHLDGDAANAISFLFGAEVKFGLSRYLVWPDRSHGDALWRLFVWFNVATVAVFLADAAVFASTDWLLTPVPAAVLGVGAGTIASYIVCDRVIFTRGAPPVAERVELEAQNGRGTLAEKGPGAERLWLIVPAHNEEARLGTTLDQYRIALTGRDRLVIVVNGSSDGTEELAQRAASGDRRLTVLVEKEKVGKGGALLAGYRFVSEHSATGDIVCYTDADAAVAGDEIIRFSHGVSPDELRVGSRRSGTRAQTSPQPVLRRVASRVFNLCVRVALPLDLKDTQCAAKALRAASLPAVMWRLDSTGFAFDLDLILSAREAGLEITEVPVEWVHRDGGTVAVSKAAPAMLSEVVRLRRKYRSLPRTASAPLELPEQPGLALATDGQAGAVT